VIVARPATTSGLRDLVLAGRDRSSKVITNHGSLEDTPHPYDRFDRRADGVIKPILRPN
jgi:glutathione-independent formaldehyde dehydrogenase